MNSLVKNIGIYTISNILNASIPFILLPLLTNYLSTTDYGILTNYNALINLLIPFVGVNLMSSLQVIYVKRKAEISAYISTGIYFTSALTILFSILLIGLKSFLHEATGIPLSFIFFISLYAFYNCLIENLLSVWRIEDKAVNYGLFRIARTALEFAIAITLIVVYDYHFEGSIYAISISYGIGALAALIILWRKKLLYLGFQLTHVKHQLSYGLPLIPHVMSSVAIMYTDKLMLSYLVGVDSNGIFSVGFTIGQVIGLLQNSFNQAWVPWVYAILKKNDDTEKKRIVKYTYLYILGILIAVGVLWFITPVIYQFIGKGFKNGMSIVFWIALGFAFNGIYKMVSVYFFYFEKTKYLAYISFFTAIINVLINLLLIPKFGIFGAALSTMFAMLIQLILTWGLSFQIIRMPWLLKTHS